MTKFRKWALGVAGAILIVVGLFSCDNDEVNNPQREETQTTMTTTSIENDSIPLRDDGFPIGFMEGDTPEFIINPTDLLNEILVQGTDIFVEVESVEINGEYLTVIGKDAEDLSALAFQAELIFDDNGFIYFPDPDIVPIEVFATHKCDGQNCTGCSFKEDENEKIIGCNCAGKGDSSQPGGYCNHSSTEMTGWDKAKVIIDAVATAVKVIVPFL